MKKETITLSKLERLFDESDFATLFTHLGKGENDPPSSVFENLFFDYGLEEYDRLQFPLKNFCIERYCLKNGSFVEGEVLVTIGFPFLITKKENNLTVEKMYPFVWDFFQITEDYLGEEPYQHIMQNMHNDLNRKFASFLALKSGQTKKCFVSVKYEFFDTSQTDQEKITKLLDELFESDDFIEFVGTLLCPFIARLYLDDIRHTLSSLNTRRKELYSLFTSK